MQVAIVGAGPAGAHLAHILAARGFGVLLFDARDAWEKPCGGGVTSKALREFEFLRDNDSPKEMVSQLRLVSGEGRELRLKSLDDFAIYSRTELGRMMRERAIHAGANLHCLRVERTTFEDGKWHIKTTNGSFEADFLVGADGASSIVRRRVGVHFGLEDLTYALGWLVRPERARPRGQADVKYANDL
ncbi:MAG: FAD-dependent monooxygenase, partial [Acidobacteriota bacterium]